MTIHRLAHRLAPVAFVAALTACSGTVVQSGSSGAGTGGQESEPAPCDDCDYPGPAPEPPSTPNAILATGAALQADFPPSNEAALVQPSHADWVYLMVGTPAPTCAVPAPPVDPKDFPLQVLVGLPPSLLVPGALDLASPSLDATWGVNNPNTGTVPEGGTLPNGTLTIVSVDATSVAFTITGTTFDDLDDTADGGYLASRCP